MLLIQVSNSFVSGVLSIALPLMMKERNVDIVVMGLVFASMPLIMLTRGSLSLSEERRWLFWGALQWRG